LNTSNFIALLDRFAAAAVANDAASFAALFSENGVYEDLFFGRHRGRSDIAAMLQRFHDTGRDYRWEFVDVLANEAVGYARFHFSYASMLPDHLGKPVYFEGISLFRFDNHLIAEYHEAWDRGVALVQLGFPAERIRRVVTKAADARNETPEARRHLDRFRRP
jgi:hypothetical protein